MQPLQPAFQLVQRRTALSPRYRRCHMPFLGILPQVDGKKQKEEEENWAGGGTGIKYQIQTDRTLAYRWGPDDASL